MDKSAKSGPHDTQSRLYEITIEGHLAGHWSEWMGNLEITPDSHGFTRLTGEIPDQSALHGILTKIRNLGLDLIAVNPIKPPPPEAVGGKNEQDRI